MAHFPLTPEDADYLSLRGIPFRQEALILKTSDCRTLHKPLSRGLSFPSGK